MKKLGIKLSLTYKVVNIKAYFGQTTEVLFCIVHKRCTSNRNAISLSQGCCF